VRYAGARGGFDWDVEAMAQFGDVGGTNIRAWAVGSRSGYTVADFAWTPCLGLQIDAASGDHKAGDKTLGTFNPLFPNGYYFTLAGYTGYVNLIHLKPSLSVKPIKAGRWSGVYAQFRADWTITPSLLASVEAVRFQIGEAIRRAGGHDSTYFNVELKYGW
jgi:Alginate export